MYSMKSEDAVDLTTAEAGSLLNRNKSSNEILMSQLDKEILMQQSHMEDDLDPKSASKEQELQSLRNPPRIDTQNGSIE